MGLHLFREHTLYTQHALWLERKGPQPREIDLPPGESTGGEILVLLDFGKEYVFSDAREYHIRWRWSPGRGFAEVYTDDLRVAVVPSSRVNEDFLDRLELIALRYYVGDDADTLDLSAPEAEEALDREGVLLLSKIISQQKPHRVDPKRNPADTKEWELVESLTDLLDRYPDSAYSGYIARFLGLVNLETLEREASWEGWGEGDPGRVRAHPAYMKALRYLTMAKDANVWPRTTALENLVWLHGLAQEWGKTAEHLVVLREGCADIGGVAIAEKLQGQIQRFRKKVEARKAKELPPP
jgi:hypothetical protein